MAKICLARVDRIGDLVLTLSCQNTWLDARPQDEIRWVVPRNLSFLIGASSGAGALYVDPPKGIKLKIKAAYELADNLKKEKFDVAVFFHVPWWVAFAFWLAAVPQRVGVESQWFSFAFFNKRLRQKRSHAIKHEAAYNLDLVRFALRDLECKVNPDQLTMDPLAIHARGEVVQFWREQLSGENQRLNRFVLIHPGMAGSARNWPAKNYRELARRLLEAGYSVGVTGTPSDKPFIEQTKILEEKGILNLVERTGPEDILAILSLAKAVVAPSTGVAHLAASLGVLVIGIYSPVRVQAPKRWAPLGPKARVLAPDVPCPGTLQCKGESCPYFDCMNQIEVDSVFGYVMEEL